MKRTLKIQNGMVIICGPSCSGKTTLAEKIFNQTPYGNKILLSNDQMLRCYIKKEKLPAEWFFTGLDQKNQERFAYEFVIAIRDALRARKFVVLEALYCDIEKLEKLLGFLPILGLDRPVTLIKLLLTEALHQEFVKRRPEVAADYLVEVHHIQRQGFEPIFKERLSETWQGMVDYAINDPRELAFDFLPERQVTVQRIEAYSCFEEAQGKYPRIVEVINSDEIPALFS